MKIIGNTVGTPLPKPNWNQNDPTKVDYIKNKPFGEEADGVIKTLDEQYIPDSIARTSDVDDKFSTLVGDTPVSTQINEAISGIDTEVSWNDLKDKPFGEEFEESGVIIPKNTVITNGYIYETDYSGFGKDLKYLVNFNGVEYLCDVLSYNYEFYIGNLHFVDESIDSNEYPFCIRDDNFNCNYKVYFDGDVEATISIIELTGTIKQIDTKYIPDTIATTEYVDNLIGDINTQLASLTEVE
jgi:hypothetical protein